MIIKPKKFAGPFFVWLLSVFLCSLAFGQPVSRDSEQAQPQDRTQSPEPFVRLTLLKAETGEPLAKCGVQIFLQKKNYPAEQWSGETSPFGVVSVPFVLFKAIDEGPVNLTVETEAYRSQNWIQRDPPGNDLPLTLELKLMRKPTIRIQLLDSTAGTPLADSDVHLISTRGFRCLIPCPESNHPKEWSGRTDASGAFEIPVDFIQYDTRIESGLLKGRIPYEVTKKPPQSVIVKLSQ